ncbi:hypothetical protein [Methyloligella halotolerans]|uniref:hypothetical protein n=1 Tax=Methyloligella halotolerans TaxID=1177755 RepID=UPI003CC94F00
MTAAWSKGRNARYAYYFCHTKSCDQFRKSVRKEKIEGDFDELLDTLRPSEAIMTTLRLMVEQAWEQRIKGQAEGLAALKADRTLIERKLGQIMERLVEADSPALVSAYEDQIRKLQAQKVSLEEKLVRAETPEVHVHTGYRTALSFVANPRKLWDSEHLVERRMVPKLLFGDEMLYSRNEGYRTGGIAYPFRLLSQLSAGKYGLVGPGGLEPPTRRL